MVGDPFGCRICHVTVKREIVRQSLSRGTGQFICADLGWWVLSQQPLQVALFSQDMHWQNFTAEAVVVVRAAKVQFSYGHHFMPGIAKNVVP